MGVAYATLMKSWFIKAFFSYRVVSFISTVIASALVSWFLSYLPGFPEIVSEIVRIAFNMAPDQPLTREALIMTLTPLVMSFISEGVKYVIGKDNNATLELLNAAQEYDGPLDSWVGPQAQAGIQALIEKLRR